MLKLISTSTSTFGVKAEKLIANSVAAGLVGGEISYLVMNGRSATDFRGMTLSEAFVDGIVISVSSLTGDVLGG